MNRDFSQALYYFLLQKERHNMGLIADETWREHIDGLLETEINLAKMELNNEFGVSSAECNNDPISKSVPDEEFWSQDDICANAEPKEPKNFRPRYMVYRIKEIIRSGTSYTFIFENDSIAAEVRKKIEEHVVKKYIDGISSTFMDGYRLKIDFKDYDSQTDFFSSYIFHENGYLSLKFKRWPAVEAWNKRVERK